MEKFYGIVKSPLAPDDPLTIWLKPEGDKVQLYFNIDGAWRSFAEVASTGEYDDLLNTPNLASVATSGDYADLSNTPSLATVATSGAYGDLSGTPDIAGMIHPDTQTYSVVEEEDESTGETTETIVLPDMEPNIKYEYGNLIEGTFVLDTTGIDEDIENKWHWTFDTVTEDSVSTFSWPNYLVWENSEPTVVANKFYDVEVILDNQRYYAKYTAYSLA